MKIIIAAIFFLLLFICVEAVTKKYKLNKELSRKFIHIASGIIVAFLPLFMSFDQIAILGALFVPVMICPRKEISLARFIMLKDKHTVRYIFRLR